MCDIINHFIDKHAKTWKEEYEENELFSVIGISQLKKSTINYGSKIKEHEGV